MNHQTFQKLNDDGIDFGFDDNLTIENFRNLCSVDGLVALPLTSTSPKYERNSVFDLHDADTNSPIAFLVTCKEQSFEYGAAAAILVAAYLNEAEENDVVLSPGTPRRDFKFARDYVVVHKDTFDSYVADYRKGSALWGGFTHTDEQATKHLTFVSIKQTNTVFAHKNKWVDTAAEKDALWRAIIHTSPLERYLKLYHLLELRFDLELVNSIKALGDDLKGIGKLLNSYAGDKEFDRLLKIVRKYCVDINFFEKSLSLAFSNNLHHDKWSEILFEYHKDSNPYKEDQASGFKAAITNGFCKAEWEGNKLAWKYENLSKFAACMVYRVRCSIAHFRLGELLLSSDDEAFVAEAAEPLLREIVLSTYTH